MVKKIKNLDMKTITCEEAQQKFADYTYGIVHMMSELQYGKIEELTVNWDELVELRAFSEKGELRLYQGNDGMVAQCCIETTDELQNVIILEYDMKNGRKLKVKEYLEQDEDGQAIVGYTRPFAMV